MRKCVDGKTVDRQTASHTFYFFVLSRKDISNIKTLDGVSVPMFICMPIIWLLKKI